MPAIPLPADDVKAVAAYIHSVQATMRGQGSPPAGTEVQPDILVGDAKAGEAVLQGELQRLSFAHRRLCRALAGGTPIRCSCRTRGSPEADAGAAACRPARRTGAR